VRRFHVPSTPSGGPRFTVAAAALALAGFSPVFSQGSSGLSELISWTIPTTQGDGTALTDLAGFNVYYGTNVDAPTSVLNVPSPVATSATVTGLTTGTWYFWVSAYDTDGNESPLPGSPVSKTL